MLVTNSSYILAVAVAAAAAVVFANLLRRYDLWLGRAFTMADALALTMFVVYGAQRALSAGLDEVAAALIGVINGVGGGILRDLLSHTEPILFKPGQFYAAAALVGAVTFVGLGAIFELRMETAAVIAALLTFGLRLASVRYDWRTTPFCPPAEDAQPTRLA